MRGWVSGCAQAQSFASRVRAAARHRQGMRRKRLEEELEKRNAKLAKATAVEYDVGTWVHLQVHKGDRASVGSYFLTLMVVEVHSETQQYRLANRDAVLSIMVEPSQIYKRAVRQKDAKEILRKWRAGKLPKKCARTLYKQACP